MASLSDIAAEIEELFYVENRTVFEIAEIVKFPVTEVRKCLEQLEEDHVAIPEMDDSDVDDLAEFYGFGASSCEFD